MANAPNAYNGILIGHPRIILEYNGMIKHINEKAQELGASNVVVAGIRSDGEVMASRMEKLYKLRYGNGVVFFSIDPTSIRDDINENLTLTIKNSSNGDMPKPIPDLEGKHVVLVDSVFEKGRTARTALDYLTRFGRYGSVELDVLLWRNGAGREVPITPDRYAVRDPSIESEEGIPLKMDIPEDLEAKLVVDPEFDLHTLVLISR